jgi:hypothetical protein
MPSSKKGRLSGAARKEINARTVDSAIKSEDVIFGRMNKHFGNGRVEVFIVDERGAKKSVQAHIRRVLTKRGATPITLNDVVGLTPREYESRIGESDKTNYDLICVLDRKSASTLEKEGKIPKWMMAIADNKGDDSKNLGDLFEFDYGEEEKKDDGKTKGGAGTESDSDSSEGEIDIDKI